MEFFGHKQKLAARIFIYFSATIFAFTGIVACYWGFKVGSTNTSKTIEEDAFVKTCAILFMIVMFVFTGYAFVVLRRPKDKCVVRSYTFWLFFWVLAFFGVAVFARNQATYYANLILNECADQTSPIRAVDVAYNQANNVICQPGCLCNANRTLWAEYLANKMQNETLNQESSIIERRQQASENEQITTAIAAMFENSTFSSRFQQCLAAEATVQVISQAFANASSTVKLGLDAMGAVETDFKCAGMCKLSYLYSFSDVTRGLPYQNCSVAVTNYMDKASKKAATYFWVFGSFLLICAIFMCLLWHPEKNSLNEPLLGTY